MSERVVTYDGPRQRGTLSRYFLVELQDGSRHELRTGQPLTVEEDVAEEIAAIADTEKQKVNVETQAEYDARTGADRTEADELRGDALKERAEELDIDGRASMKADELREAVAAAEAEIAEDGS